ncbi:MAG: ribulose-phosphate 3-epimerase [Candidatus Poseidoniia archaeon]|nr:ribulose-phosphate 3-epimerase [Candidatus Poseidoniia archaeon]MDP7665518.1 ribulose-phosphate 3-epimerase [Candidatus Poseidoniia archaeon]
MVDIAPSMLGADFGRMREAAEMVGPHSAYLHMDVMDGHFVPNLTMGPDLVKSLEGIAPLDVHLMVTNPIDFIKDFRDAGAEIISVHVEANNPLKALESIKKNNMKAGIALNPSTPENSIEPFIDLADLILVMSVEPGYGGQDFHEDAVERVRHYKEAYPNKIIEVDGGVAPSNSERLADAGADILVAGSAIFKADDPIEIIKIMKGS